MPKSTPQSKRTARPGKDGPRDAASAPASAAGGSSADARVAGKRVAGKPVAGKPVAGKPVAGKPVAGKPAGESSATAASGAPASASRAAGEARVSAVIQRADFPALIEVLKRRGHTVVGPVLRDGAILYDEIEGVGDLPEGWTDEQAPGSYRLKKRKDRALFGHVVGPHAWKRWFLPAEVRLWAARREGHDFELDEAEAPPPPLAIIGARPCELAATRVQDAVLLGGPYRDAHYDSRRRGAFIVAVDCTEPGGTCFCASMGTGPRAVVPDPNGNGGRDRDGGPDLALTELVAKDRHRFAVRVGSEAGAEVLRELPHAKPTEDDLEAVEAACRAAERRMGRSLETEGLKEALYANMEHPEWEDLAKRCMACGNCTMVCPTCFCTTVEDVTDLTGERAERWRRWDSCFTRDFSYIYGGQIRRTTESRYRQWLTHKLAYWQDQFGTSGCVGCGRCITWCPVGIDITEEVASIRSGKRHR